jgi:hypothetical protein
MTEGVFDIVTDVVVQRRLDVVRNVRFLDLLDPHIKRVELLLDQVVEVVCYRKDIGNAAHEERKESQAQELGQDTESVLKLCRTGVITVTDGGNNLKYPVEGEDVLT